MTSMKTIERNIGVGFFTDNKEVLLVDVRDKFLNADGSFRTEMYTEKMLDGNGHFLHRSPPAYTEIIVRAVKAAMAAHDL